MQRNISGGCGEIPVIMAAAVALTGLAALVAGRLGQLLASSSRSELSVSSTLPRTNSLICPLIISVVPLDENEGEVAQGIENCDGSAKPGGNVAVQGEA